MTYEEIKEVVAIMGRAHDGCYHCAGELVGQLWRVFPERREDIETAWEDQTDWSLDVLKGEAEG